MPLILPNAVKTWADGFANSALAETDMDLGLSIKVLETLNNASSGKEVAETLLDCPGAAIMFACKEHGNAKISVAHHLFKTDQPFCKIDITSGAPLFMISGLDQEMTVVKITLEIPPNSCLQGCNPNT